HEALHEVLWVSGGRKEVAGEFAEQLRRAAGRMLVGREVRWKGGLPELPGWGQEERRQVFLCFKEALANVVRHSSATEVELELGVEADGVRLGIRDNGRGFGVEREGGTGLGSLRERARRLGGECVVRSGAGAGTLVELRIPLRAGGAGRRVFG
ncbi:MAG: hypothetical protein RLZZ142_1059, partial [Verrucomicrobiota bacterium]